MSRRIVRIALVLLAAAPAWAASPSGETLQRARSTRLDGRHFTADVDLAIERDGKREDRRLTVWRDDDGKDHERILARFDEPADLKGFGLLFLENDGRPNDYFIHQPELKRVRRVSEAVVSQDIYGVDLEFLGFGVAQGVACEAEDVEAAQWNGRKVWKLHETPVEANQRFDERVTWIDPDSWVPLRTEHRRGGMPTLVAEVQKLETIHGVETPTLITFDRPGAKEIVTMTIRRIDYETPIAPEFFSTLQLIKR